MVKQKIVLFDIDHTIFDTELFKKSQLQTYAVFDEVHETLTQLQKIATLGIFSEGDLSRQKEKMKRTGLDQYFCKDHIYIVPYNKKNESIVGVLEKYSQKHTLFFVDDKLESLYLAKKYLPSIFTIWIKRGIYAAVQQPIKDFVPDAQLDTLAEIYPLITNHT